jgi:lactose/raffinose/galactose permease
MKLPFADRTFKGAEPPRSTVVAYEVTSLFRDSLFEFFSLFMLLYVQLASPIAGTSPESYIPMFFTISMVLIGSRILAAFCWTFASHFLEVGHFRYGRYRTFIFLGCILTLILFLLMFFVSPLASGWGYVALFLVFYTLMDCSYSIQDIAYWSFINTLTDDERKKGRIGSLMNFFVAIGTYTVASIAPAVTAGDPKKNLTILAMTLLAMDFIAQMVLVCVMKERYEPEDLRKVKGKSSIFDGIRILFKDRQIRLVAVANFLFFLAQDVLIGNSATYFYYEYGYGSFGDSGYGKALFAGGEASFIFTICFGVGIALSQFLYPFIAKKFNKKQIMLISAGVLTVTYLFLFFYGFLAGNEYSLYAMAFILAFFHGLVYLAISMNCFDCSEYYEWKYHENKNAPVQSLKAFSVILANGVQTGIFYLFLAVSGLVSTNSSVAELEARKASGESFADFVSTVNQTIHSQSGIVNSLLVYRSGITLFPLIVSLLAIFISVFAVQVNDEKKFAAMVKEVEARKEAQGEPVLSDKQ